MRRKKIIRFYIGALEVSPMYFAAQNRPTVWSIQYQMMWEKVDDICDETSRETA
jgi:hypothetical protein